MSRGLKVLYVENDEALLGLLGQSIRLHPKVDQLVTARNSSEALEVAESNRFDAALLFIDSYTWEIAHLLAQTGEHIENCAFTSIGIAE